MTSGTTAAGKTHEGSSTSTSTTNGASAPAASASSSSAPSAAPKYPRPRGIGGPSPSIGLNLRVTGYCNQGGRKYMEDVFSVAYQQTEDEKDLEYAFFGIFDGHGGSEAAIFAKEHLMDFIVRSKLFWSDDDNNVLKAIHDGFVQTHAAMWKELEKWPKTPSGLPSTAGTTASIAFIRRGKIYIGHVGDSAIVLGTQDPKDPTNWLSEPLTRDHKPESIEESQRIAQCGGKVVSKSGVPRVVWNRPRMGHKGPVRRSTHIDEIPFLAVARSLGDLWSYNSEEDVFIVSPEPDTYVYQIDITKHRCLILGTDGAWNMLTPAQAIRIVCEAEKSNEQLMLNPASNRHWINPSQRLVDRAIEKWNGNNLRADNTSVVTVMLDPPGPPRAQVLKRQRELAQQLMQQPNYTFQNHELHGPMSRGVIGSGVVEPDILRPHNQKMFEADRGSVALVTNTTPDHPSNQYKPPFLHHQSLPTSNQPHCRHLHPVVEGSATDKNGHARGHPNPTLTASSSMSSFPGTSSATNVHSRHHSLSTLHASDQSMSSQRDDHPLSQLMKLTTSTLGSAADSTTLAQRDHELEQQRHRERKGEANQDIQCNVITSSSDDDDDDEVSLKLPQLYQKKSQTALKKSTRLSRELSNLKLDSPVISNIKQLSRRRTRSSGPADDDLKPGGRRVLRSAKKSHKKRPAPPPPKLDRSHGGTNIGVKSSRLPHKCRVLNAKVRDMEQKVQKRTDQLLRSSKSASDLTKSCQSPRRNAKMTHNEIATSTPALRTLRPRSTPSSAKLLAKSPSSTPLSSRKRKVPEVSSVSSQPVAKSPKTNSTKGVQMTSKPIITRARTAKVLQLKK